MDNVEFTETEIKVLTYITTVVRSMMENQMPKEVIDTMDSIQMKLEKLINKNDEN